MLWTIFVILLVLWLLGLVTSYTFGGFIHILLVVAIAVVLIQLITCRRAVSSRRRKAGRPRMHGIRTTLLKRTGRLARNARRGALRPLGGDRHSGGGGRYASRPPWPRLAISQPVT